jgi:ATP-dependent Lon protease
MPANYLPQFPLQIVVFPGEKLNLHIFEPRYRQLIRECADTGITFGIPCYLNQQVMPIGTEIQLEQVAVEHEDGTMDINTLALGLYRIEQFINPMPDRLYAGAKVQRLEHDNTANSAYSERILEYMQELFELLNIEKELPSRASALQVFDIAHYTGLPKEKEYELLTMNFEAQRQEFLLSHLEKFLPQVKEMSALQEKVRLNGHFKQLKPPYF